MAMIGEKKDLNMLLRNEWEFYDPEKTKKQRMMVVIFVLGLMWILFFMYTLTIGFVFFTNTIDSPMTHLGIPTILTIVLLLIALIGVKKMNMDKGNWWFSSMQNKGLDEHNTLQLATDYLHGQGILFTQEKTIRTATLFITMFDLGGKDFKMRVWFSKVVDVPILEIGFGPENRLNKKTIEDLRNEFSNVVAARYGPQNIPALPIDTTTLP